MPQGLMQIGAVAELTGLSLRTIRYYEEVGLVVPSARSQGGFRLYSASDVERLQVIMHMKPLDFTLDDMRDLLRLLEELDGNNDERQIAGFLERLAMFRAAADARVAHLREQLEVAESFAGQLRRELTRGRRRVAARRR